MNMFYNNYPNRKDKRRRYYDSRAESGSCRNNGRCSYCRSNRLHSNKLRELSATDKLKEYLNVDRD